MCHAARAGQTGLDRKFRLAVAVDRTAAQKYGAVLSIVFLDDGKVFSHAPVADDGRLIRAYDGIAVVRPVGPIQIPADEVLIRIIRVPRRDDAIARTADAPHHRRAAFADAVGVSLHGLCKGDVDVILRARVRLGRCRGEGHLACRQISCKALGQRLAVYFHRVHRRNVPIRQNVLRARAVRQETNLLFSREQIDRLVTPPAAGRIA